MSQVRVSGAASAGLDKLLVPALVGPPSLKTAGLGDVRFALEFADQPSWPAPGEAAAGSVPQVQSTALEVNSRQPAATVATVGGHGDSRSDKSTILAPLPETGQFNHPRLSIPGRGSSAPAPAQAQVSVPASAVAVPSPPIGLPQAALPQGAEILPAATTAMPMQKESRPLESETLVPAQQVGGNGYSRKSTSPAPLPETGQRNSKLVSLAGQGKSQPLSADTQAAALEPASASFPGSVSTGPVTPSPIECNAPVAAGSTPAGESYPAADALAVGQLANPQRTIGKADVPEPLHETSQRNGKRLAIPQNTIADPVPMPQQGLAMQVPAVSTSANVVQLPSSTAAALPTPSLPTANRLAEVAPTGPAIAAIAASPALTSAPAPAAVAAHRNANQPLALPSAADETSIDAAIPTQPPSPQVIPAPPAQAVPASGGAGANRIGVVTGAAGPVQPTKATAKTGGGRPADKVPGQEATSTLPAANAPAQAQDKTTAPAVEVKTTASEQRPTAVLPALPVSPGLALGPHPASPVRSSEVPAAAPQTSAAQALPAYAAEAAASPAPPADAARTIAATPQSLEVGVASGTHGWLRLRAELTSTGEVTAAVVASSTGAAQALHRELPALQQYLSREQVNLASVAVTTTSAESSSSFAAGTSRGGQQPREQPVPQAYANPEVEPWSGIDFQALAGSGFSSSTYGTAAGGGWVNVRV